MAQSSGYGAGPGAVDLSAGVTGGTTGVTGDTGTTGTTGSTGSPGATDQAKEKAQEVAGQAKEQAQQVAGQAKGRLRGQVDSRSTQVGEQITTQVSDIRTVSQQLREQGKEGPAKLADQAADRAERVGTYLRNADADTLLDDVERFARSKPWAVLAGGLVAGFAAARALKASSVDRYRAGGSVARRSLPAAGTTTSGYRTGDYGSGYGREYDTGAGYGREYGTGAGTAVSGGGITGSPTPVPPATSVPPVVPPSTGGAGTPPAGGF